MSISGILFFVTRAARFALAVCLIYAVLRLLWLKIRKRRFDPKSELVRLAFVAYFAALAEIIALRGGSGNTRAVQPVPLRTTLGEMKNGAWPFVYHLVGNMIWFVPLGMFLGKKGLMQAALTGAGVSLALEILQWLLMTGVSDIDDVILNALGTLAGKFLIVLLTKLCLRASNSHRN